MKHVSYGEKSLLMDDESADTLIEFASMVAASGGGDTVTLRAINMEGNETDVTFLLDGATMLAVQSATTRAHAPTNDGAVLEMREKIDLMENPPVGLPDHDRPELSELDDFL
ncbi:hypothetical protein ABZ477_01110 [Microbacterium sp. NPDC019599]|uniref:hypothetical protein n=1 Tax=Microbacterium sp. NPDC019599 TaxID=3154690 RepID=UPI0033D7F5D0